MGPVSDDVYFPSILTVVLRGKQGHHPHFVDGENEIHTGQVLLLVPRPVSATARIPAHVHFMSCIH